MGARGAQDRQRSWQGEEGCVDVSLFGMPLTPAGGGRQGTLGSAGCSSPASHPETQQTILKIGSPPMEKPFFPSNKTLTK